MSTNPKVFIGHRAPLLRNNMFIYEIMPPLPFGHSHDITKQLHDGLLPKKDVVIYKIW